MSARARIKSLLYVVSYPLLWLMDAYWLRLRGRYPVRYFAKVANVGDCLNAYLIEELSGRRPYRPRTEAFAHLLGVGSILHLAGPCSRVWGSGLLREADAEQVTFGRLLALRGERTRELLAAHHAVGELPLGDPALLLPRFCRPHPLEGERVTVPGRIGVVCHVSERDLPQFQNLRSLGAVPIDVTLPVQEFVDALCSCLVVLSSSLHGLILADAYGIPNQWLVASDRLLGGEFKFRDYYSTTACPASNPVAVPTPEALRQLLDRAHEVATVKPYRGDLDALQKAFSLKPKEA